MRVPQPPVRPSKHAPSNAEKVSEEPKEEGSNLWMMLTQIPRPYRNVPFPRNLPGTKESVGEVAIWPLTHGELIEANAQADQRVKALFSEGQKKDDLNLGYNHSFANELAVQQLWRACRDPNDLTKPAFPSPKAMSLKLTGDEIGVLYNHFLTTQAEVGPITARMSDEEYEAWVRRIAEAGEEDPTASLSLELRMTLLRIMASQLVEFWTATCSPGSAPVESSSTPSSESGIANDESDGAVQ
jgi:hypothetical protein